VDSERFHEFFEALDVSNVEYLHLLGFEKVKANNFHKIVPQMANLVDLYLGVCEQLVNDKVLLAIFESLVKLQVLKLGVMNYVSKAGFLGKFGISNLRQLKIFRIMRCPNFSDDCLDTIDGLQELNSVTILECPKVNDYF
jgi:hypothetical protein